MQKTKCQRIKSSVLENIAPLHYGQVSLNYVCRVFSHMGSKQEIEKCLDELVAEELAEKVETNNGIMYLFEEMALEFGRKWEENLSEFKTKSEELEKRIKTLEKRLIIAETLRDVWIEGWKKNLPDEFYPPVANYISSVFFGQYLLKIRKDLYNQTQRMSVIKKRSDEEEKRLSSSFKS